MPPANRGRDLGPAMPRAVLDLIAALRAAGHAAYVVGGSIRDLLLDREPPDWDLATDALPERVQALLPGAAYENKFGTVAVRRGGLESQITTFREDHDYADFRRPHRVEFGTSIEADLARRDFTVNAMAWGAPAAPTAKLGLVDPFGGQADLAARLLRAVGDPTKRFDEDALRMVRAIRFATTLGFTIDAATLAALRQRADLTRHLSGERIAGELDRLLAARQPSAGLALAADTGLLAVLFPELESQRGLPQNKTPGEDLWQHTLRTVDAAPRENEIVRLAALLHDIGKPPTLSGGRFPGHDVVGAEMARGLLERLHASRERVDRVSHLVRHHMFHLERGASDAAIRRFIVRIGAGSVDDLLDLRAADNVGSGRPPNAGRLHELRRRVHEQLEAKVALDRHRLKVDGRDLMAALGLPPGPALGAVIDELTERVIGDQSLNERETLLRLAREIVGTGGAAPGTDRATTAGKAT